MQLDLRFLQLDLQNLKSVKAAAAAFKQREKRLDVLINNAGVSEYILQPECWLNTRLMPSRFPDHGGALRTNNRRLRTAMASQLPLAVPLRFGTPAIVVDDRIDIRKQRPRADHQPIL